MLQSARLQSTPALDGSVADSKKAYAVVQPDHAKDARHLPGYIGGSCMIHWRILLDYQYRVEGQHSDRFLSCFVEAAAENICWEWLVNPMTTLEQYNRHLEWVMRGLTEYISQDYRTCGGEYYKPQGFRR